MSSSLIEASPEHLETLVGLLQAMMVETEEFEPAALKEVLPSVKASFSENVFWFLFIDEAGQPFGTCYLQSVYNYWRVQKRYYLGGLYFLPSHRGQKRFHILYKQLQAWVRNHDGCQIYCHIDEQNHRSRMAFEKEGFIQCSNKIHRHAF